MAIIDENSKQHLKTEIQLEGTLPATCITIRRNPTPSVFITGSTVPSGIALTYNDAYALLRNAPHLMYPIKFIFSGPPIFWNCSFHDENYKAAGNAALTN